MGIPTGTTVQNLTRCKVYPGWFPSAFCDQFIRKIGFEKVEGYGRVAQMNDANPDQMPTYEPGDAMFLAPGIATGRIFPFARIGDTVEVDTADVTSSGEGQNQLDLQVEMKKAALIRRLANQLIEGDGVPSRLRGLAFGTEPVFQYDPQAGPGTAPTLDDYHRLITKACPPDGAVGAGPDALVMHPRTKRQLHNLLETGSGGTSYQFDEDLGVPVLTFEGIPVYFSNQVSTTEDITGVPVGGTYTSVYALKLHGPTAVRILHQGGDTAAYGITVQEVPAQLGRAVLATTVRGYYSVFIPWQRSIARLRAIDITAFQD